MDMQVHGTRNALLMLFAWHIDMPRIIKNICSYVGPSMFGVYLIHEVMHNGREIYKIPQACLSSLGCSPFACVVITAMSTFTFCIVVDLVRRLLVRSLKGITDPWVERLESLIPLMIHGRIAVTFLRVLRIPFVRRREGRAT